jgi:predicted metal-dependent HD superfamily phosphohydrolase
VTGPEPHGLERDRREPDALERHRPERSWPARLAERTDLRDRLLAAYASPDRGYHDTRHLAEVLEHLGTLLTQPEARDVDQDAVVLAAWFHDAVYDGERDDEERSAALAESTLTSAGVPDGLVAEVARLVRLTAEHRPAPDDVAGQVLSDADLAVLASRPERYDDYVRGVRREYSHLDDATFAAGRAGVLRALLAEPRLFRTPYGHRAWEETARNNMDRELHALTTRGAEG